jgi:RES domain
MLHTDNIDEDTKRICCGCVGETFLSEEIERTGAEAACSYCTDTAPCWNIEALTDRIETAFDHHYIRTANYPDSFQERMMADNESSYEWEREGDLVVDAIEAAANIPNEAATDVQAILDDRHSDFESAAMGEETEFAGETRYEEKRPDSQTWHEEWHAFEQSLKTEARYFSRAAAARLALVFGAIDKLKTTDGRPLVVEAGPKRTLKRLYRARVFQSGDKLEEALCRPDRHIGSPPARLASAGRMNARGISVFYGATVARAALAEVRPPVGSKVAVARFDITRPLRLLDLTALENVKEEGSIFDPTFKDRLGRAAFLQSLGEHMTRPVMPDDEAIDYLPTQAIADFLATENEPVLDGIIFQSAQIKGGRNVVLFHKAARVEDIELPAGTKIDAHTGHGSDEGWEIDYSVSEQVPPLPPAAPTPPKPDDDIFDFDLPDPPDFSDLPLRLHRRDADLRETALRVDPGFVEVHHVEWVSYRSTTYTVRRHRFVQSDPKF